VIRIAAQELTFHAALTKNVPGLHQSRPALPEQESVGGWACLYITSNMSRRVSPIWPHVMVVGSGML
jgi:hypothetical protein